MHSTREEEALRVKKMWRAHFGPDAPGLAAELAKSAASLTAIEMYERHVREEKEAAAIKAWAKRNQLSA